MLPLPGRIPECSAFPTRPPLPSTRPPPRRSSYDGATPPAIPPALAEACARSLSAASSPAAGAAGYRFPPFAPDICLANFYERSGRLGMHQVRRVWGRARAR